MKRLRSSTLPVALGASLLSGCLGNVQDPPGEDPPMRVSTGLGAPVRATFPPVANALQPTCGTLDCHGQVGRNLRFYGSRGMRLDQMAVPGDGKTTDAEYDETYWSLISLEPEILSQVVRDGGAHPERLTIVRKGRGQEHHKGGMLLKEGDQRDKCLVSWLAGKLDEAACLEVKRFPSPIEPPPEEEPPP